MEKISAVEAESPEKIAPKEEAINLLDELLKAYSKESEFEDVEAERKHFTSVDSSILSGASEYEKTLGHILERYGCNANVEKIGNGLFRIPLAHHYLQRLPDGYGYIGGAARATLLRELGIDQDAQPRDKDIVRILDKDILGVDAELAQKYSAEDCAHGHGVQELQPDYFKTRDFTINETLVCGDWVYITKDCLLDTVRRILRFTKFEKSNEDENGDYAVSEKLLTKAVRLSSEEIARGRKLEMQNKEAYQFANIRPFYIALHLDRAFKKGDDVASEYVRQLVSLGQLPDSVRGPIQAMDYLLQAMENPYIFQYAPEAIMDTDEGIDAAYQKFGHLIDKYED